MQIRAILVISSILFSCGFLGLLTVRISNPFFRGLGWVGAAFAAGSLGATLFSILPHIAVLVPNTLILLAYVCLHICILELTESPSLVPALGIVLLILQAAAYFAFHRSPAIERIGVFTLGLALAVQTVQSAMLLNSSARPQTRAPSCFSVGLLLAFALYNLCRSILIAVLGIPQDPQISNPLELTSAVVFLGTGLGLGFGMFWMASSHIRVALENLANTDPLTGLCNRRTFTTHCNHELLRSLRSNDPFSLFLFDLDHFKRINDLHGHSAGDTVLCAVADRLRQSVRDMDVVGRWGGEEFVVLLPGADSEIALYVAERLRSDIASLSIADLLPGTAITGAAEITISVGVATYRGPADTIDILLQRCDAAMYQAKADGRNRVLLGAKPVPCFAL